MHRAEAGTERHRSWWLRLLTAEETLGAEYVKAHARKVADVMTRDVITAGPETPLHEIKAAPISFRRWPAPAKDPKFRSPMPPFATGYSRI